MLQQKFKNHRIILSSSSPRRQQFLRDLGLVFDIETKSVEEVYPNHLEATEIAEFLAVLKANAFKTLAPNELLITGDTIVCLPETQNDNSKKVFGKPKNEKEAFAMLRSLSGTSHEVISSVCVRNAQKTEVRHAVTTVNFKNLSDDEINYYIENFKPFDKAGAYGIQEWIGQIGVTEIHGSYFNVMGLPVHLLYKLLIEKF